jgi:hypothetical protein
VFNNALDLVGRPRISSFADGSDEAILGSDMFGLTRDELLRQLRPSWARRDAALVLLRQAPDYHYADVAWDESYPDLPWLYEYEAPADCLVPLQVKPRPRLLPVWRPRAVGFLAKINALDDRYTILTNQPDAIVSCIYRVINPDHWLAGFTELMVEALAKKLALPQAPAANKPGRQDGAQEAPRADAA